MPLANTSNQNPIGNSKAAKFVAANPLAPLADPFSGMVRVCCLKLSSVVLDWEDEDRFAKID